VGQASETKGLKERALSTGLPKRTSLMRVKNLSRITCAHASEPSIYEGNTFLGRRLRGPDHPKKVVEIAQKSVPRRLPWRDGQRMTRFALELTFKARCRM